VLCNFEKAYHSLRTHSEDGKRFKAAVMEFRIFETLELMPDAQELLDYVKTLKVNVELLTSLVTFDEEQGEFTKSQKQKWLDDHGITYKVNYSRSKEEKSMYAHSRAILVDDSIGCTEPFNKKGGHGILHTSAAETIKKLDSIIYDLTTLRFEYDSMGSYI
jgi:hypothetical protein